jgi:methyl-accepting chemotaxis protein
MLGIGIPLLLAVAIGIVSILNINSMLATNAWVEHTYQVIGTAEKIIASAVDMETGARGYALAGKEEFLEPYQQGEQVTYETIAALQNTVSDNPEQVERLEDAASILREWQEQVIEPEIALRQEIGDAKTMNDMAALVKQGEGKRYFDTFRGQIARFMEREQELMRQRRQTAADATAQWVEHTYQVIDKADRILLAAVNMETGLRGFLLAGHEEFLEP